MTDISDAQKKIVTKALEDATRDFNEADVNLALKKGADINAPLFNNGWTALMYAAYCERADFVLFILSKGADVFVKGQDGKTVYEIVDDKSFSSSANKKKIKGLLLNALPDAQTPVAGEAEMKTRDDVKAVTPIEFKKTNKKNPPGTGGLKL